MSTVQVSSMAKLKVSTICPRNCTSFKGAYITMPETNSLLSYPAGLSSLFFGFTEWHLSRQNAFSLAVSSLLSLASIPTHLPLNFIFSGVVDWRPCLRARAMRCYFIAKYVGFQVSGLRKPENFTFLVSQSLTYFIRKDRHCTPYPRPPTGLRQWTTTIIWKSS